MKRQIIRLTEHDLHHIIQESVKTILTENANSVGDISFEELNNGILEPYFQQKQSFKFTVNNGAIKGSCNLERPNEYLLILQSCYSKTASWATSSADIIRMIKRSHLQPAKK